MNFDMTERYSEEKKILSGLHFTEQADEGLNMYRLL